MWGSAAHHKSTIMKLRTTKIGSLLEYEYKEVADERNKSSEHSMQVSTSRDKGNKIVLEERHK